MVAVSNIHLLLNVSICNKFTITRTCIVKSLDWSIYAGKFSNAD